MQPFHFQRPARYFLLFCTVVTLAGSTAGCAPEEQDVAPAAPTPPTPLEEAEVFFQGYVALNNAFDVAVADLYADSARIVVTLVGTDGQTRSMEAAGTQWKTMLINGMSAAKEANDRNTYTDVKYELNGEDVGIYAARYSVLKNYSSPHALLISKDETGTWHIIEEFAQVHH